eukprot:m.84698 g.84698  ORF g.84698 m.84698 type:complete len:200 (+) comp21209_c1_seq3:455-1054(+)
MYGFEGQWKTEPHASGFFYAFSRLSERPLTKFARELTSCQASSAKLTAHAKDPIPAFYLEDVLLAGCAPKMKRVKHKATRAEWPDTLLGCCGAKPRVNLRELLLVGQETGKGCSFDLARLINVLQILCNEDITDFTSLPNHNAMQEAQEDLRKQIKALEAAQAEQAQEVGFRLEELEKEVEETERQLHAVRQTSTTQKS